MGRLGVVELGIMEPAAGDAYPMGRLGIAELAAGDAYPMGRLGVMEPAAGDSMPWDRLALRSRLPFRCILDVIPYYNSYSKFTCLLQKGQRGAGCCG